jgi:hypothetical protein
MMRAGVKEVRILIRPEAILMKEHKFFDTSNTSLKEFAGTGVRPGDQINLCSVSLKQSYAAALSKELIEWRRDVW